MPEKIDNPERFSNNTVSLTTGLTHDIISENQGQVSKILGDGRSNQFTPEEKAQIENFLSAGKFNAEDFLGLPNKLLGKYLILRVIEKAGDGLNIAQNIDIFKELDEEIALKLVEAGEGWAVGKNIEKFNCQNYSNIVLKLLDEGEEESIFIEDDMADIVLDYKFKQHLNKEVALKMIEKGYERFIYAQPYIFHGLDSDIFFRFYGNGNDLMLENISWFNLNNAEIEGIINNFSLNLSLDALGSGLYNGMENPPWELYCKKIFDLVDENPLTFEWSEYIMLSLLGHGHGSELLKRIHIGKNADEAFLGCIQSSQEQILKDIGDSSIESLLVLLVVLPESFNALIEYVSDEDLRPVALKMIKNDPTLYQKFSEKISKRIYPSRDYSPKNLSNYSDKSEHLEKYTFNSEGYTFTLSNLLGYKLKEGMKADSALLEDYKARVENITHVSTNKDSLNLAVNNLAQIHEIKLQSTGLESRILEFLLRKQEHIEGITKEDFDILIAYQLMGRFEQFVKNSNDKLATSTEPETIHMVQILALLQEYGDPLKESVRKLEKLALQKDTDGNITPDATFLLRQFGRNTPKEVTDLTKDRIIDSMIRSFSQRPEHTITDLVIQKSILEKCKSVLQKTDITLEEQEEFAKSFEFQDFMGLSDVDKQQLFITKWKQQVAEYFGSSDIIGLNLRGIAKTQQSIYSTLQQETQKFEEIVDKNGLQSDRHVFARFGKSKYDALARGVGDICLGQDEGMWKNPEYFELVLFDTDRLKCIGTVMLLSMPESDGKKYLLYGPNPSVEFDDKVSSFKLFDQLSRIVTEFAQVNNFDGVVFDPTHGRSTNRSGDFQTALEQSQLRENDGEIIKIDLKKDYLLGNMGGGEYIYKKDLSFLWSKS